MGKGKGKRGKGEGKRGRGKGRKEEAVFPSSILPLFPFLLPTFSFLHIKTRISNQAEPGKDYHLKWIHQFRRSGCIQIDL